MSTDLEIIRQLEKKTGIRLEPIKGIYYWTRGYKTDSNQNVIRLSLANTRLKELPQMILQFKNLTELYLCGNTLVTLPPEIRQLKNLTILNLGYNTLVTLPPEIGKLKNLTVLNLGYNALVTLPPEIGQLKNLTILDLNDNDFDTLPPEIGQLKKLTVLNLSDNTLVTLPLEIGHLKNSTVLNLNDNPIIQPPPEIAKKGVSAIRDYFNSLKGEKQALNEVKVLLVGDGDAGKTSLLNRLLGKGFDKDELQTSGINIEEWDITEEGNKIKIHLWDFGGQEIMHATHQFFLSKRSLYVLVLDGRKDDKTEYWLKHIESFGSNSPILVVLNKIDEYPGFDVNRKFLKDKYKGIRGFYPLSCKTNKGVEDFSKSLTHELANVELIQSTWSKSWFNVKEKLENMQVDFIDYKEYEKICFKEGINEKNSQNTLVDFLNDLGVILHFKDFELLDMHVLRPKWVTNGVYKIINSEVLANNKGVLRLDLLDEILKKKKDQDYYYPCDKYMYLIDLMKKFELCYTIDTETVLIPDLLNVQEPPFDFDDKMSLKFIIKYDFLPKSVMPRFIVKMNKDIKDKLQWRTGVVLEDKGLHSTALIKADEQDKKISIYVNGEQQRDYFSIIRKTFRDINSSFKKLEAKELVPLPDNVGIDIEYDELIGLEKMGKKVIVIGKLKETYPVKKLLNGIESEVERKMKTEKSNDVNIHIHDLIRNSGNSKVQVEQKTAIDIKVNVDLPAIQSDFEELKDILIESNPNPKIERKLNEIGNSLDEVSADTGKENLNKPLNKIGRFLKKLEDENSDYYKLISKSKKGIELAKKLGKTYNKFANYLALPHVPDLFLKN